MGLQAIISKAKEAQGLVLALGRSNASSRAGGGVYVLSKQPSAVHLSTASHVVRQVLQY